VEGSEDEKGNSVKNVGEPSPLERLRESGKSKKAM